MKRLIMSLAVAAAVAGPIAGAATAAYADPRHGHHEDRWDRREDRWDRQEDRRDRREDRWDRHEDRWDRGRHNGYYYRNKWYYGPPPVAYYGTPYYRPGYAEWRRGGYLPPYYRGYVVNDYYRYHLRRFPAAHGIDISVVQQDLPMPRREHAADRSHQGGLARAVGSDDSQ